MTRTAFLALALFVSTACGSPTESGLEPREHTVELAPGMSKTLQISIESATQLSLISETGMNARIEAALGSERSTSEWSTTPFVDVHKSGTYSVVIQNVSSAPLAAQLLEMPLE